MARQRELPTTLDSTLAIRINTQRLEAFVKKSKKENRPHTYTLREMIDAYNEDRLTITKPTQV